MSCGKLICAIFYSSVSSVVRQPIERIASHSERRPLIEGLSTHSLVEVDRQVIPVEHRPLEPAAISLDRDASKRREQREPDSLSPCLRGDEQIFEVDPALCEEGRIVVEEECEAEGLTLDARDYDFCPRPLGEERCTKFFLRCDAVIAKPLVGRKALDELQNERDVLLGCSSYFNRIRQSPGPR